MRDVHNIYGRLNRVKIQKVRDDTTCTYHRYHLEKDKIFIYKKPNDAKGKFVIGIQI